MFDASAEFVSTYTARPAGTIEADARIRNAPGVTGPLPLYRAGVQAFLDPKTFAADRNVWAHDSAGNTIRVDGRLVDLAGSGYGPGFGPTGSLTGGRAIQGIWAGNQAGDLGMYAIPVRMEVDGRATASAHFLAQTQAVNDEFVPHMNPLDPAANVNPKAVRSLEAAGPSTPRGYIGLAVVNVRRVLFDMVGKERRPPAPGRPDGDTSLDPALLAEWTELHYRVAGLPNDGPDGTPLRQRDVVERRLYLGLKSVEIARPLDLTEKQVGRAWLAATEPLMDDLPGCAGYFRDDA